MKEIVNKHVDITGLGNSGKAIVSDYLMEFNNIYVPRKDFEFNLLRALVENWTPIRSDDSIRRFIKLTKRLGSRINFKSPNETLNAAGFRYEDFFPGFSKLTNDFINEIITFSYKGLWPYVDYHSGTFDLFTKRVFSKIDKKKILEKIYFSNENDFVEKLNDYVYNLLSLAIKDEFQIYVTHNAFEPFEVDRYFKVMQKSKLILVTRDPRDIYANIIKGNNNKSGFYKKIDPTFYNICAASNLSDFIIYQKKVLSYLDKLENPNLLIVSFESFINNYDLVSKRINNFLGLKIEEHVDKFKHFDPKISIKNIGVYQNSIPLESIKLIENELSNYYKFI